MNPLSPECIAARTERAVKLHLEYPENLPISAAIPEIIEAWKHSSVIIVGGETGSGKTTQLPKAAIAMGGGRAGRIGCTQPRRLAATAMARRLAAELQCEYGEEVGSKVRFEEHTSPKTILKFMTDGTLLAETLDDPLLRQYDTLIVDEAHERTLNIDFLLGLLRNLLTRRTDLKVAISSATLDLDRFRAFFPGAPVISVAGRTYPVEDIFQVPEYDEELPDQVARAVDTLSGFDPKGDILVFLPGEREIRDCTELLTGRHLRNTEILPLYARLSAAEQQKVFHPGRMRRIILSTNVAETSLTIPRVTFCIDSGLARISRYNPRSRIQELQIEMISQASARQRRGRCGRTADGICVHLYSENDLASADAFTDPEIKRSSLAGVILQMAALHLPSIDRFPFMDPPSPALIREGLRTLTDLRALDQNYRLTPDGRMLARLPVDPQLGRMLLAASHLKCVPQMLVLAAGLSVPDVRERPTDKSAAADQAHAAWKDTDSDFIGMLKLWNGLMDSGVFASNGTMRRFCRKNFLNFTRVREWRNLVADLADSIRYRETFGKVDIECRKEITEALISGIPRNLGFYEKENRLYRGVDGRKFVIFPGSGVAKAKRPPEWIIAFALVETSRVFGRTVGMIDPRSVELAVPHLCSRVYDQEHFEAESGFVRAREKVLLGSLILSAGRRVDFSTRNPAAAREIFIREGILEGLVNIPKTALGHFHDLREELLLLELKMRRPGMLYDGEAAARYFLTHLPEEVNSVKSAKIFMARHPQHFTFKEEDFTQEQFISFDRADYPDFLTFSGVKFKLAYNFAPGEENDGVTMFVPENELNLLPPHALDYPVPGYYADFGEALLRALPRDLRRQLGGIGECAKRFADYLKNDPAAQEMAPADAMAEFLEYDAELSISPNLLDAVKLPEYLKLKAGLLNPAGKLTQVIDELPERTGAGSRVSNALPGAAKHTAQAWKVWPEADAMPLSVEVPPHSGRTLYPAFTAAPDGTFGKTLYLKKAEAVRVHRKGILTLFCSQRGDLAKFLRRRIRLSNELKLSLLVGASESDFLDELLASSLERAAGVDLWESVRSGHAFAQIAETMAMQWGAELDDECAEVEKFVGSISEIRALARRAKGAGSVITDHLNLLFMPGFLRRPAVWSDYKRYLRGLRIRAERLLGAPGKDAQKGEALEAYFERFDTALDSLDDLTDSDGLYDFWGLLEECRLAVWAPEVQLKIRAPLGKLAKAWDELRI